MKPNETPHGVWLLNLDSRELIRPNTKTSLIEAFKESQARVYVENVGIITPVGGRLLPISQLVEGTYHFVGPDPYTNKKFYGKIIVTNRKGERKVSCR